MSATTVVPGQPARAVVEAHRDLAAAAKGILDHVDWAAVRIAALITADREAKVRAELAEIGLEKLGELTDRNLRLNALLAGGYRTALDVLDVTPAQLDRVPGVGLQTARGVVAAADQLAEAIRAGTHLRIDLDRTGRAGRAVARTARVGVTAQDAAARSSAATNSEIVALVHRLLRLEPLVEPYRTALRDYATSVASRLPSARRAMRRLTFALRRRRTKEASMVALAGLVAWEPWLASTGLRDVVGRLQAQCAEPDPPAGDLWNDFERRSVQYYTVLRRIVPLADEALAARGMLTADLAERVAACPLDESLLRAQLRGYQAFGARFVLNQGRVLLGDEMGLGKTVQAIAAMADRAAAGERHFLVVCPASVLINWLREVAMHSELVAHRLHGEDRDGATARWLAEGGVGVTTFDGLEHVVRPDDVGWQLGMFVVDEAHFVKNPHAQRSITVARWAADTWRVLFMTGTPMENRLDEFIALVRMLQPEVAAAVPRHLGLAGVDVFRHTMAPVYLRRNQVDVLVELPELVSVDEWETLTPAGEAVYRAAVASGNFMAMRRAAFATPDPRDSTKLERLLEIVADAHENGHRVVVYSFFREVLDIVVGAVGAARPGSVYGPITGSVAPEQRQAMIDRFSEAPAGAVLVAQVQAGGVGVNIQAASVVVLCEPQVKPTTEAQAIARLHRMGQVHTVRAHRLLVEGGVDERILQILAEKDRLFDAYIRDSSLADEAVRAVDVTQAQLARDVVAAEQARLGYGPVWDELATEGLLEPGGG